MRKNVIMTVVGCVKNGDIPEDVVKLFTTGYLSVESNCWRLKYTETDPETSQRSHITLKMEKNSVSMSRDGQGKTLMEFTPGKRFEGMYQTPYGDMNIGIFPRGSIRGTGSCTSALRTRAPDGHDAGRVQAGTGEGSGRPLHAAGLPGGRLPVRDGFSRPVPG